MFGEILERIDMALKKRKTNSSCPSLSWAPKDPRKFLTWDVERRYHESLQNRSFVPKRVSIILMLISASLSRRRAGLCFVSTHLVAPIVREFHANLPHKDGSSVCVKGKWVPFHNAIINKVFELGD